MNIRPSQSIRRAVNTRLTRRLRFGAAAAVAGLASQAGLADMGPLKVHPQNPRYFMDGDGHAVYLTGSHTWDNFQDNWAPFFPVTFDWNGYLNFLDSYNHNYIRLWRQEVTRYKFDGAPGTTEVSPQPYARTGPGTAGDGLPKFNLDVFDASYFNRLRSRCQSAQNRGMYVGIVLFEGHTLQFAAQGWYSHPFKSNNNINGINGDVNNDGSGMETHELVNNAVLNYQKAYIRKVIDTVNDLDNIVYEISNESHHASIPWQRELIDYIKWYQSTKAQQHPVVFSTPFPNFQPGAIWNSNADAVAPGSADGNYGDNPPAANGSKVIIADSDHIFGCGGNADWVWKCFTRGMNPIYMDSYYYGTPYCSNPIESMRVAMGESRAIAQTLDMAKMLPKNNLASTGYCLAEEGSQYIVFVPGGTSVSLNLSNASGSAIVTWIKADSGDAQNASPTNGGAWRTFNAPYWGSWVLRVSFSGGTGGGGSGGGSNGGGNSGGGGGSNGGAGNPNLSGGDQYGRAVAKAGDVNNDGFIDLIVGAPYADPNGNANSGRAYIEIYSPSENRFVVYYTFSGEHPGDRFGWAVGTAGDVNNDGFDDVMVGAPYNDDHGTNAGKVYIYSGRDGSMMGQLYGEHSGDLFGYSVDGKLNLNGDDRDDVIIGAPLNDDRGPNAGKVYLFAGNNWSLIKAIRGQAAGDRFGHSVTRIGRTDNDNFDEFAVGAPLADAAGADSGRVYVFNGKNRGLKYTRNGARAGDRFGWSISGTGRSNHSDQFLDFAVGAPYFDVGSKNNAGRVYLFSGRNGKQFWTANGAKAGDLFGMSLSGIGDVNGSGSGDVIIGAPNSDANGSNSGRAYIYSGGSGEKLRTFNGQQPGERFGWSVAGVGDVNSDFLLEVTVGASRHTNTSGQNAGVVYLLTAD